MNKPKPTKHSNVVFNQLCKLIPVGMVRNLASEYGVDKKCRTFSAWSHVVSLLYAQLTHSIGLNDVCDALRHHSAKLFAIRGATPPSCNGLSNANKTRDADMMEALFWKMLTHLQHQFPHFGPAGSYSKLPRRFKKAIYSIDSSTITLVANCMDWAKHRRRKAAAKLHLRLNLQTFLPSFAVIEEGSHHDSSRMMALCAGLQAGEIAVFDKAYVHFKHLFSLTEIGVFWVTRAKDNMCYHVCKKRKVSGNIVRDDEITLKTKSSKEHYPQRMRRVVARVEVNGKFVEMVFITNNMDWAASSVCDLYQSRWAFEVFFKQIKQTLQICDFLGHSKQAIRWQLWSALLLYLLLRFQAWSSDWPHSFARLFTMIRGLVWDRFDLSDTLRFYGTAGDRWRMCIQPQTAYLQGFTP
ncbi:MAG: IS4 family transposase [Puniceicoccaceae bacterium]|nr:IS4 family transposase [Puniceicoccaceae bacterium]